MSYLEPCWDILSDLGGNLGLSEVLLEPSWAILDAPTTSETPRPGPGEGVGGRGKPFPEGEEGVVEEERKISLDRLSPKGLAGFFKPGYNTFASGARAVT